MTPQAVQIDKFGKVAVLMGGTSAEREVSLSSGQACLQALLAKGVEAIPFDPSTRPLHELVDLKVDRALIMLHGRGGEDGTIQGALEYLGLPYTGCGVLGSAIAMDKIHTKQIWQSVGISTAKYRIVTQSTFDAGSCSAIMDELGGIVMVKPAREGSSIGMAKVNCAKTLATAVSTAFRYDSLVLLEQYIVGKEYTVGIIKDRVLPSIRMSTPHTFYDYAAKYEDSTTQYFCPSGLSDEEEKQLRSLCLDAFNALSASGWGRIDAMRDEQGRFYLLELNTIPGMTATSLIPKAAKVDGVAFEDLVCEIVATSFAPGVRV
ncbi:D-alanine--D-alanine ligase [Alteromonas sediminis]|uniref:D-alanine--D-alanine ligase n=1 Tax=Alteromonas sediminis TaxID=2259342 RepID=A0A3N5ZD91_9ALTE|nr:D-alanine--D-alanine ligase [Alteromonas sediminis]RPJ67948.1 D-alanine--D-alanine ligase [Alteromonas sediminis]